MGAASRAVLANGIERGDRVAIWAPNCAEWIVAALGAVSVGAVLVPLNTRYRGPEAAYILESSGARMLFTVQGFLGLDYPAMLSAAVDAGAKLPELERIVVLRGDDDGGPSKGDPIVGWTAFLDEGSAVPEEVAAGREAAVTSGDMADLVFTSGTTGHPKGAMTTHGQTLRTFATWSTIVGLREGDRYLIVNPFFHTFGYKAGILACLMTGATMVPEPTFDVGAVLRHLAEDRISVLPGPPTIHQTILDRTRPRRLRPLRPASGGHGRGHHPRRAGRAAVGRARRGVGDHRLRAHRGDRHGDHVPPGRLGGDDRRGPRAAPSPTWRCGWSTPTAQKWTGASRGRSSSAATT